MRHFEANQKSDSGVRSTLGANHQHTHSHSVIFKKMIRALYTSASGMNSQQMNLDLIANNLANVNTTGFKKSKIEFQDLLYQEKKAAGADVGAGQISPGGIQIGHGSRPVSTSKIFTMVSWLRQGRNSMLPFTVMVFSTRTPNRRSGVYQGW